MENNQKEEQNQSKFKPASNPFLTGQLGSQQNQDRAQQDNNLVGSRAEDKKDHTPEEEPKAPEQIIFQWQAPEFSYTQKPFGWFLGIIAFFAGLIALAVWFQQWITIVLLVVMGIALSVWATRKPKILVYRFTNYGVEIENKKYLFDDFRSYYKYMDYNQPTLDLIPSKRFGTLVSLPLATQDANEIEAALAQMVPLVDHKEDIADRIFRRLRF